MDEVRPMRLLGNLIWFIFGGVFMGLAWTLAGLLCAITIVGIPAAIACFRIAGFTFFPFGKEIVDRRQGVGSAPFSLLGNILWAILLGWELALGHLLSAALCAITIIGIPFAWQHLKLAYLSLVPFGKEIIRV